MKNVLSYGINQTVYRKIMITFSAQTNANETQVQSIDFSMLWHGIYNACSTDQVENEPKMSALSRILNSTLNE